MESKLYDNKVLNSLGQKYEQEIKDALAPLIYKTHTNRVKKTDFLRLLVGTVLAYRTPLEFNRVILKMMKHKNQE